MAVTHAFVSAISDGGDANLVRPSNWNADHVGDLSAFIITNEAPSGTINGVNDTFTLANTPVVGSVMLYRNGLRQKESLHFTISGGTITMLSGNIPSTGNWLMADYLVTVT